MVHSKIEADDEFGLATQREGSERACLDCIGKPGRKPNLKVRKYLWARGMSSNQERRDLWWALAHQTSQNGVLTKSGLLESGTLMKCWKQERWDPWVCNQLVRSLSTQTSLSLMTTIWIVTPPQNRTFRWSHSHSCTVWMIECERYWTSLQKMQCKTATNVLWFGECFMSSTLEASVFMERITLKICIPSKIQKISRWNRCSRYLRSW